MSHKVDVSVSEQPKIFKRDGVGHCSMQEKETIIKCCEFIIFLSEIP